MVRNTTYAYSKPNARYNQLSVKLLNRKKGVGGDITTRVISHSSKEPTARKPTILRKKKRKHTNYDQRRKNHRVGQNRRAIKVFENIKCTTGRRKDTRSAAATHAFIIVN